jgi:hypothetical protein
MVTEVVPYCQIHGYDFGSIVYGEGVEGSGGGAGVEEIPVPGRKYADIRSKGRAPKKYKIKARSTDREEIEAFLAEVNTAPEDSEFYPYDAERFGLIASAYAALTGRKIAGSGKNFYEATAEIVCREAWLCGPDKGCAFDSDVALDYVSELLENEGQETAPINYLQASGDYLSGAYVEDLSLRIAPGTSSAEHDREIQLCEKMLRDDIFEMGWRKKEIVHSWDADLGKLLSELSLDVHGKTSGGSITSEVLTLDNSDYFMIPFYGPNQISGSPDAACLELQVSAVSDEGLGATCQVALETDLSDIVEVDHDELVVGQNIIPIPSLQGEGHVAIGIKAAASGSVSLTGLKGTVKRYIAPQKIPAAESGEEFKIRVEKTAGTYLKFLEVCYNDRYWY